MNDATPVEPVGTGGGPPRWVIALAIIPLLPFLLVIVVAIFVFSWFQNASAHLALTGRRLNNLATHRDGFLVLGTLTYGLGYLVWSIHAWREHLGILPALRFQYLLAGAIPLGVIWLAVNLLGAVGRLPAQWGLQLVTLVVLATGGVAFVLARAFGWWAAAAYVIVTALIFSTGAMFGAIGALPITVPWIVANVAVLAVMFYAVALYPNIPQELGGIKPQCAYLDLKADQLEPTLRAALSGAPNAGASKLVRSKRLAILFEGASFTLVRPAPSRHGGTVYKLDNDAITASASCS